MIIVLGRVQAHDGQIGGLLAAARAHVARARQQPGCLAHNMAIDDDDPNVLVFTERWSDLRDLQDHLSSEETRSFGSVCGELGKGAELEVLRAASVILNAPGVR